jgi:hypothetical protein
VDDDGGSNCCELLFTYGVRGCTGNAGVCGRGLLDRGGLPVSSLTEVVRHDETLSSLNYQIRNKTVKIVINVYLLSQTLIQSFPA